MINNLTIDRLKKLSYISGVKKTKDFNIFLLYGDNKKIRVSRRIEPKRLIQILNKIKQEINYETKNEENGKILPFYFG